MNEGLRYSMVRNRSWGDGPNLEVGEYFTRQDAKFIRLPGKDAEFESYSEWMTRYLRQPVPNGGLFRVTEISPDKNFVGDTILTYECISV